ncbi:MAG: protein translocase subunit SecD [Chloroflexota bacterium]|nr:protein translocase subunit SecD [Chloroflexota bacterium]
MRLRPWHMAAFIAVLTLLAGWVALPGESLDINGYKSRHPVRQGLDLRGGLQVLLEARPPSGQNVDSATLEGTRDTIERRVNGLGVSEPLIQTRGNNQIIVELPGVGDPEEAVRLLQQTALLEIIDPMGQFLPDGTVVTTSLGGPDALLTAATPGLASPIASPNASPFASPRASPVANVPLPPTGPVYTTIISGADLADAFLTRDPNGQFVVSFELTNEAANIFGDYTSSHLGSPMSIVVDKQVISSPRIDGTISREGVITGMGNAEEARNLAIQLKAGSLAVPLEVVQSRTVGPTLGQDSIDKSIIAGIVGLGMVALFMVLYYRLPGILSVAALLIYTVLTFALFKVVPVTLTLAGIAGFILSIGMAVDANVLIFARLKEELRGGRTLSGAIEAGFDHAWPSIRDSNISTMITSAILYWFGQYTGATIITGFALTLFVGVTVSMFTAITVTRTFLRLLVGAGMARHRWWFGVEREELSVTAGAD